MKCPVTQILIWKGMSLSICIHYKLNMNKGICGNKMPNTSRCNRGFHCRFHCLLNMFRAPICWGLCVQFAGCLQHPASRTHNPQLRTRSATWKPQHEIPQAATTLELLMMGTVVSETCWASNKICNKSLCCIYLAFYFHILTTMHGQNHIKFDFIWFTIQW